MLLDYLGTVAVAERAEAELSCSYGNAQKKQSGEPSSR
jgi:hypothetical protein